MQRFLLGALLLTLAACAGTAPPQPLVIGKPLQGRLEQGIYHDPRNWFGIATPIGPDDPHYGGLTIEEQTGPNISFVAFALANAPGEYYRAYMEDFAASHHPVPDMDTLADSAMKYFGTPLMQKRFEPVQLIAQKPWQAGPTGGVLRLYTERAPAEALMQNLGMAEDYTAYILMYVATVNGKVAVLWIEWPDGCKVCTPPVAGPPAADDDPIDRALAANGRSGKFLDSFHYGPN